MAKAKKGKLIRISEKGANYEIRKLPHEKEYFDLRSRLSDDELDKMKVALNKKIEANVDSRGHKISVASWLPGHDWSNTPYQPIYDKVCGQDYLQSAFFFGELVMEVIQDRCKYKVETWFCSKDKEGRIKGNIYWQSATL